MKIYTGPLDFSKMEWLPKKAYRVWGQQAQRNIRKYSSREFIAWYITEYRKRKKWKNAHVSRVDHSKPYSFENIKLEEAFDNVKERNDRLGNPTKSHKKVVSICFLTGTRKIFNSKVEAADFYGVNEKTVWNHCNGRTKQFFKFGTSNHLKMRFEWVEK